MNITRPKLDALKSWLARQRREGGALLVVYAPEDELMFRDGYEEIIQELQAKGRALHIFDFRLLLFNVLGEQGLLHKAFELDAAGSREAQGEVLRRVHTNAQQVSFMLEWIYTEKLYDCSIVPSGRQRCQ
jgi:hypothetical protein